MTIPPKGNQGKILIIDDDPLVSTSVKNLLLTKGYDVAVANSSDEGMRLATSSNFDLVITDIRMPKHNGVETVKRIKEIQRNLGQQSSFMFITGYAEDQVAQSAASLGIAEFLLKPFDINQLITSVERELTLHRHNTQQTERCPDILPANSVIGKWKFSQSKFSFEKPILLKETNIMGNTYYDNYITWQGEARERLLLNHPDLGEWMRLNTHIKMITHSTHHRFFKETTFGDVVRIEATSREIKNCSFILIFRFFNMKNNMLLGEGWQKICFSNIKSNKLAPVPQLVLDLIEPIQERMPTLFQPKN